MKKRSIVLLIVALLLLTGYTILPNPSVIKSASANTISVTPSGASAMDDDAVVFVDKQSDDMDFRPLIDGPVSFEENLSMQASVYYPADGTPQSIAI